MALFKKQRRPTPFNVKPIYWDPEKEEREERERRIKSELGLQEKEKQESNYTPNIKGKFKSAAHGDRYEMKAAQRRSRQKMFLFAAVLLVIVYFLFSGLPMIERLLENYANS